VFVDGNKIPPYYYNTTGWLLLQKSNYSGLTLAYTRTELNKIHNSWIKKYYKNNPLESSLNALTADPEGSTLLTVKFAIEAQDPKPPPSTLCPHNPPPYKSDFLSPSGKRPLLRSFLHQNSGSMFVFTTPAIFAVYHNLNFTDLPILGEQYKSWHS
jgi:hypothetical protein